MLTVNKIKDGDKITLALSGRLDTNSSPQLQDALMAALEEAKEVTLDFSEVAYVSSAGLRVLLMGQKTAKAKSASMILTGVADEVMEVFEMTGFAEMLTIQ